MEKLFGRLQHRTQGDSSKPILPYTGPARRIEGNQKNDSDDESKAARTTPPTKTPNPKAMV